MGAIDFIKKHQSFQSFGISLFQYLTWHLPHPPCMRLSWFFPSFTHFPTSRFPPTSHFSPLSPPPFVRLPPIKVNNSSSRGTNGFLRLNVTHSLVEVVNQHHFVLDLSEKSESKINTFAIEEINRKRESMQCI